MPNLPTVLYSQTDYYFTITIAKKNFLQVLNKHTIKRSISYVGRFYQTDDKILKRKGLVMNREELVKEIAKSTKLSQKSVSEVLSRLEFLVLPKC